MRTDSHYRTIHSCRSCYSRRLDEVIDFGEPFISDFVEKPGEGLRAPLRVLRCADCGLVQLADTVDRDLLFRHHYWYQSGTNESMIDAMRDVAARAQRCILLYPEDAVLDIGANDGTLLRQFPSDVRRCGVEPAPQFQTPEFTHWWNQFWPLTEPDREPAAIAAIAPKGFRIITSIASFYSADDPNAYVAAIKQHLAPNGVWCVQFQDEDSILRDTALDYFCHEHVCLWGSSSFRKLLIRHGLSIESLRENHVNGGSIWYVVRHAECGYDIMRPGAELRDWGLFADRARARRDEARHMLTLLRHEGQMVLGVAASTKANTVLQWYGLGPEEIPAIIDRNPEKIGRYTVGSNIRIISEEVARTFAGNHIYLALAWHFLEGLRQRDPDREFLTLLPEVRLYQPWRSQNRETVTV